MITDRLYHNGAFKAVQMQSEFSPTYFYYFRFIGKKGFANKLKEKGAKHYSESNDLNQNDFLGVSHGDDIFLIYSTKNSRRSAMFHSEEEQIVSNELINLYYNFATKNLATFNNLTITKVEPSNVECLELFSSQNYSMVSKNSSFGNGMFWDSLNIIE